MENESLLETKLRESPKTAELLASKQSANQNILEILRFLSEEFS